MSDTGDPFLALKGAVKTRLDANSYFSDSASVTPNPISVITEDEGDLATQISKAIDRIGLSVVIAITDVLGNDAEHSAQPQVSIVITELSIINRAGTGTQKSAVAVGVKAWAGLWKWAAADYWAPFIFKSLKLVEADPDKSFVIWELIMETSILLETTSD